MPTSVRIAVLASAESLAASGWFVRAKGAKSPASALGMAEYFDLDVTLVRVVWLILGFMTGVGFLGYIVAWIVMPDEPYMLTAPATSGQQVTNQ